MSPVTVWPCWNVPEIVGCRSFVGAPSGTAVVRALDAVAEPAAFVPVTETRIRWPRSVFTTL